MMARDPNADKIDLYNSIEPDEGSLFGDIDELEELAAESAVTARIARMKKSSLLFRAMILVPEFPLRAGEILSARNHGEGYISTGEGGFKAYTLVVNGKEYPSLSSFAKALLPQYDTRDTRSGKQIKATPDGWNTVFLNREGKKTKVQDLFQEHWKTLNMSIETMEDVRLLAAELDRRGFADQIADIRPKSPKRKAK